MPSPPNPRVPALLLTLVFLAACTRDELMLAPSSADRPWPIPRQEEVAPPAQGSSATEWAPTLTIGSRDRQAVPPDRDRRYDLAGLIDLAQRNNPETRVAWEQARQAALAVGLAESTYVPQISAEALGGFQHTPLPIPTNLIAKGYFTSDTRELLPTLTAKWLLFDFGQRASAEQAARGNSFVANVAFTGAHQKLIYGVSRDYFALGAARGRLRVARKAMENAVIVQDSTDSRRARGLATTVQVAQARRETAQARFNLDRATGAEHSAYAALIASIGIAPALHVEVADNSAQALPKAPSQNLDQLVQVALVNRPDLIAALGKIKVAEAGLAGARATYYPTIGLEAQAYQNVGGLSTQGSRYYSINEPGANLLLKLTWPLFDGGARDARVQTARSEIAAAQDALDQAGDAAAHQVTDAYESLQTSFAEYSSAMVLTDAAQTAYDAALDAYRHGVGTYPDLVNAETALSQADSEKEDAHANVFTAAAALAFATGSILAR